MAESNSPQEIFAAAQALRPWLVELRRDFHRHPELGLEEHRTSQRVQQVLGELGVDYVAGFGGTGVLGTLQGPPGSRAVALRADLDALPIAEQNDVPYRSQEPGKMHACGHDVHTTVLLGAARLLGELGALPGTVKLLFQPAEETVGGAQLMIEGGALDNPRPEAIFGLHVEPTVEVGSFELHYGQRNASSDAVRLVIHGRSGHAAYPAGSVDAIVVAAQVISALQTVVSRNVDARDSAVLSLGTIAGGTQSNIVADRVELNGTVRTLDPDTRRKVLDRLRETAEGVAKAFGGRAEVTVEPGYPPVINHDPMVELVRRNAGRLVGKDRVTIKAKPNMGVEDFAFYLQEIPGAFFSLGVRNEAAGIVHPVHHGRFDVDEDCLPLGVAIQVLNALSVLEGETSTC